MRRLFCAWRRWNEVDRGVKERLEKGGRVGGMGRGRVFLWGGMGEGWVVGEARKLMIECGVFFWEE